MSFDISSYRVSALYIYPIKSCAGIALDEAVIGARGFVHDRAFMLINLEGHFLTQRAQPRMALIHPQLCRDGAMQFRHRVCQNSLSLLERRVCGGRWLSGRIPVKLLTRGMTLRTGLVRF